MSRALRPVVFRPRMDWWVAALFALVVIVLFSIVPLLILSSLPTVPLKVLGSLGILLTVAYIVDIALYSLYILDKDSLVIVSHVRKVVVPYRTMRELRPGGLRGLISFRGRKRFALSQSNILIRLHDSDWKVISLSPQAQDSFINLILDRIDHERSSRVSN